MSDLRKILLPGEMVAFRTQKSPIIFSLPILWTLVTLAFTIHSYQFFSQLQGSQLVNYISTLICFVPAIIAFFSWLNQGLIYVTSDFIITNQRVIMREGFFIRHSAETRLSAIAEIQVMQSLIGQLFNFGSISVNSFGGGAEIFSYIRSPYEFQKKVSEKTMASTR
jgi:uncharacterized membrane protein YdbT with pleckstrin-like domain